ncbi:hypothetical protein [Acinetobacter gerneri]|jgi:hypothetical protein|uniref:hypothetical protein n=1 Tax=Acinetobacter gerneri TaxID=202952 RepID=UPI0023F0C66A|nr:hypothetical protein [Acinetobacter gerneri]MCH4243736.1 hypothetical protein [Acinetobacter gerneri]
MKYLALCVLVFTGCASNQPQPLKETPECMNYRGMMTAPMAPDALDRLKQACENSKKQ